MPPSKRKPRRSKAADLQLGTSDVEMPASSPTRPSTKKRKANNGRVTKADTTVSPAPEPPQNEDESDDEEEEEPGVRSSKDLLEKVISNLTFSKDAVMVAREHANEGLSDDHKISAFAKIAGKDWTYFVREQTVNIGRPPDDRQSTTTPGASSPIQDLKDQFPVHIDLGPSKIVSRHHASIFYDSEWPADEGGWHIRVNGRNGVRVNNILLRRGNRQHIKSGSILEIAGTQMMFVTPGDKVEIDPYFVERAEAAENGAELDPAAEPSEEDEKPNVGNELPGYQSLAPAPPNFKRASTPPQHPGRGQQTVFDSKSGTSPMYGRGMMMESTQEIDYSRDAAKDLKPPYSYAHMIAQAIFSSEDQKLTLSNIYSFIADKYAFYRYSNSGWQNSIRHNLSLNKAFQKVPRRTDEPGKGMKWQIAPEHREEYWKKQQRRVGNSSNPSSPASNKDINPNFRGANGQNLGYDTTMVYQFPAKDAGGQQALPKLNMSFPPFPPNNPYHNKGMVGPSSQPLMPTSTPQRRRADTSNTQPELEDSPLPQHYPSSAGGPAARTANTNLQPFYALPTSSAPQPHHSPSNPTLSSSYLDTPFDPSQHSIITPAPLRQNPRLAPPSTLVAPSKFMPESSPAGPGLFWKGFLGGITPGPQSALPPDMSPEKLANDGRNRRRNDLDERDIMSSSPPPMDGDGPLGGSPSKPARGRGRTNTLTASRPGSSQIQNITAGHSPTKSNGPNPMPASAASNVFNSRLNTFPPPLTTNPNPSSRLSLTPGNHAGLFNLSKPTLNAPKQISDKPDEDESDNDGGFDLARGFAPIGSQNTTAANTVTGARVGG